jgi:hypothetical protein
MHLPVLRSILSSSFVRWAQKMLRSQTTPTPSTKGGEKEKVRLIMGKGKVEHPTQKTQAAEAKEKGQAIDLQKEEEKVGVRNTMKANPPNPWVNPNVVQPTKERRLSFKENACNYCGIFGHQSRDCRKRLAAETKTNHPNKTNNSATATQVTFDIC